MDPGGHAPSGVSPRRWFGYNLDTILVMMYPIEINNAQVWAGLSMMSFILSPLSKIFHSQS